jgi:hypothetical protein
VSFAHVFLIVYVSHVLFLKLKEHMSLLDTGLYEFFYKSVCKKIVSLKIFIYEKIKLNEKLAE